MCKAQKLDPLVEFFKMAGSIYDATKVDYVNIEEIEELQGENESLSGDKNKKYKFVLIIHVVISL